MREGNAPAVSNADRLPSTIGGITRLAYARAKAADIALDPLLKKAGLTRLQIEDAKAVIRVRDQIKFLDFVAAALEDDCLGFHLARTADLRQIGLLYYVLASSKTLIEALQRAARYSSINNEGIYNDVSTVNPLAYRSTMSVSVAIWISTRSNSG